MSEEHEASFKLKLAQIKDMTKEEEKAVMDFLDSVHDANLSEEEWIELYAYNGKRRSK